METNLSRRGFLTGAAAAGALAAMGLTACAPTPAAEGGTKTADTGEAASSWRDKPEMPADIAERDVIVLDPMLATGGSASAAITFIKGYGCKHIKLMNVIAAPEGIECIMKDHPDVEIYVAGVDEKLNEHAYIVPGLGDAGDRIFGTK